MSTTQWEAVLTMPVAEDREVPGEGCRGGMPAAPQKMLNGFDQNVDRAGLDQEAVAARLVGEAQ